MGAEQIPDKFFEKIPGGFFTPSEKKDIDKGRKDRKDRKDRDRHYSEERRDKRSSRRDRSPPTEYSDHSSYDDSDYEREREQRKKERRRAKSAGHSSRSLSRGRGDRRSKDLDGEYSDSRNMAQPEQGAPYFPPPPTSEYRPYNPQEYSSRPAHDDHRPSSAGYTQPQVNTFSRPRRTTLPMTPEHPTPMASCPPRLMNRTASNSSYPFPFQSPSFPTLSRGTPVSASFSPSYEPPLAALLHRPPTNTPQPATGQAYPSQAPTGHYDVPHSATSRYMPGPGYAPSPPVNASVPPPPVGTNSPPYAAYHPGDYPHAGYQAPGNAYPSPPPLSRARSNSQPSTYVPYQTYIPPSASQQQIAAYDSPPSRRGSTKPRREHRHRARSADTHSQSSKNTRRDDSRMAKMRGRFDDMDLREKGLAAAVGGALAGGLAGRQLGKSRLTTLAGAAAGALGGRAIAEKRSKYVSIPS